MTFIERTIVAALVLTLFASSFLALKDAHAGGYTQVSYTHPSPHVAVQVALAQAGAQPGQCERPFLVSISRFYLIGYHSYDQRWKATARVFCT